MDDQILPGDDEVEMILIWDLGSLDPPHLGWILIATVDHGMPAPQLLVKLWTPTKQS